MGVNDTEHGSPRSWLEDGPTVANGGLTPIPESFVAIDGGIPGGSQECDFMNATLQTVGDDAFDVSIATYIQWPDGTTPATEEDLIAVLRSVLTLAAEATGGRLAFEVQVGPFGDGPDDEGEL